MLSLGIHISALQKGSAAVTWGNIEKERRLMKEEIYHLKEANLMMQAQNATAVLTWGNIIAKKRKAVTITGGNWMKIIPAIDVKLQTKFLSWRKSKYRMSH